MNLILLAVVLAAPPQAPVPPQGPPVDEARIRQIVRDELKSALAALEAQPRAAQPATAPAFPPGYLSFVRDVEGGAGGVLFVGRPVPTGFPEYRITLSVSALAGVAPGVYQCDSVGGVAVMARRAEAASTPRVLDADPRRDLPGRDPVGVRGRPVPDAAQELPMSYRPAFMPLVKTVYCDVSVDHATGETFRRYYVLLLDGSKWYVAGP